MLRATTSTNWTRERIIYVFLQRRSNFFSNDNQYPGFLSSDFSPSVFSFCLAGIASSTRYFYRICRSDSLPLQYVSAFLCKMPASTPPTTSTDEAKKAPPSMISPLRSPFELLLKEFLVDYNFDPNIRAQMENGQKKLFEDAKTIFTQKFSALSPDTPLEECQRVLFFPNPSDMEIYVRALNERAGRGRLGYVGDRGCSWRWRAVDVCMTNK